jgi:hypothetical protein
MKIASNTPLSFYPTKPYEFVQLGEGFEEVSCIILMLEKNWGAAHIDKINALTYWISLYPKSVPCYLIGCQTTIPSSNFGKYTHPDRDRAISLLCAEVLARSSVIGARDTTTHSYLTEVLGLASDRVNVLLDPTDRKKRQSITEFLQRIGCPPGIERSIYEFQLKPRVFYERPISYEKDILISIPRISVEPNGRVRLSADFRIDGDVTTIWCETSEEYGCFLLSERADAFLCIAIPLAMRIKKNIVCEARVTEQFLHNLVEIMIPHLCAYDGRLFRPVITAEGDSSILQEGGAVATGMSCGVDSLFSTFLYYSSSMPSMKLTHLYCGNYLYGNDGPIYRRSRSVADELDLPIVQTTTNINTALRLPHLQTHFFKTMFGVLCLRKLFRTYYYSSAEDFSHFTLQDNSLRSTAEYELLLLYTFSSSDIQIMAGGVKYERFAKTQAISSWPIAHRYLNVCLHPEFERNCGRCDKCVRTLLAIDATGELQSFSGVFDIDSYRLNRLVMFKQLVRERNSLMLSQVYKYFAENEPSIIKQAEILANEEGF